jgi:hypothetical protein
MNEPAKAQQISRSAEFNLACSAEEAFPMFSPEGERTWVPGWNPQPIFPDAIEFSRDTVFRQGNGGEEAIWTIVDVDLESHCAEYVKVAPASHAAHIVVKVQPINSQNCRVSVTYAVTAFGIEGTSLLEAFSESSYAEKMRNWKRQITACLEKQVAS